MRKFEFKLGRVREFRHMLEEKAKQELQETQRRVIEAEMELGRMIEHRKDSLREAFRSVSDRLSMQAYINRLDEQIATQESIIAIIKQDEEFAHERWLEVRQDAEVMDKLHENAHEEYVAEANREEQNELDEWATRRRAA